MTVYDHIKKDKNADLAIADSISDAPDICAKDNLIRRKEVLFQTHDRRLAGEPATAESITAKDPNHVDTFSSDFAFSDVDSLFADARLHDLHTRLPFQSGRQYLSRLKADQHFFVYQNILSLIAFIISHRPFADELVYAPSQFFSGNTDYPNIQQSLPDRATVVPIIISVNKTQLSLISGDRSTPSTLLAGFIPTTKIHNPLLKSQVYHYCIGKLLSPLENAAKSRILLACADGRTRQCYPTICAILADYEEQVLLTSVKKNRHCTRCTRTEQFTQLQQERCLNKGHDDFVHPVNCFRWKHHNFNIHVSLATDTLHLLLKGLDNSTTPVTQESSSTQLNERFRQVMHSTSLKRFNNKRAFTEAIIQQLIAVVSPLFISKAPFALHFIRAVCDLVTLAQYKSHDEDTLAYIQGALERINVFKEEFRVYQQTLGEEKNFNYPKALDSICTRANSEAHHITIVKQFYSMTNKKEYILQICLHNSQRTALLAANHATVVKQSRPSTTVDIQDRTYSTRSIPGIQPHSTKLPLSEVAANIAISNFTHAAAVFVRNKRQAAAGQLITSYNKDRLDVQEFEHRDNRRQSRTVTDSRVVAQLHLILTIINHTRYDKDRKHIAYIRAFSEVLLFNNNRQINNTTRMLSTLQAFKFYDLSTIIRPVHLVPRDLPNSTTRTTILLPALKFSSIERYSGSHILCPRRVSLIYPPRPHPPYLNPSPHPPLDHSYSLQSSRHHCPLNSSQVRFVLLLPPRRPVRQHHKTRRNLLLRQLEILVNQALVLVRLVAHAAYRNRADLNPLPPQRRRSLVARQCRRRRNAAQQIRRVQRPIAKTLRGMRPISTNNDSSRHKQQQRPPIPRQFSKTNDSTPLLTTES
ncbi:hypothetical protein HBH82_006400 [Parastagonospora nodorum]|nr:hypothetical protein HBH82_006400 [Parastagonospora nodorum]KAH4667979.1 hypothetical protein HBH78_194810 [Parastagonospora nodorum]